MDERNIDLRDAVPPTPELCRNAVLHAASTYTEEQKMRRPYKLILVVAVITALLCGTVALAIANYYSVRDYVAYGMTSESFENAIVPVEKKKSSNGITFTLGDAVFDGRMLAFTVDLSAEENAESKYIMVSLDAYDGDKQLNSGFAASGFDYGTGLIYPYLETSYSHKLPNQFGVTANMTEPVVASEITWRFKVYMLKPLGQLVQQPWVAEQFRGNLMNTLREMQSRGEIAVYGGRSIADYLEAIGTGPWGGRQINSVLDTGMFEMVNTLEFEFSTPVLETENLMPNETFRMDGYTITVKSITTSLMQVDYELEAYFDEPKKGERDLEQFWYPFDQNGERLLVESVTVSLGEDKRTCTITGNARRISDQPLTEITFSTERVRYIGQYEVEPYKETFTVKLVK